MVYSVRFPAVYLSIYLHPFPGSIWQLDVLWRVEQLKWEHMSVNVNPAITLTYIIIPVRIDTVLCAREWM